MKKETKKISPRWSKLARTWTGNKKGRHCHWCKNIKRQGMESQCRNRKSKFYGTRIRTWDGEGCAKECKFFELQDWYKEDKNFDKYFNQQTK